MCFEISTGQVQPDKVETVFERVWRASLNPECVTALQPPRRWIWGSVSLQIHRFELNMTDVFKAIRTQVWLNKTAFKLFFFLHWLGYYEIYRIVSGKKLMAVSGLYLVLFWSSSLSHFVFVVAMFGLGKMMSIELVGAYRTINTLNHDGNGVIYCRMRLLYSNQEKICWLLAVIGRCRDYKCCSLLPTKNKKKKTQIPYLLLSSPPLSCYSSSFSDHPPSVIPELMWANINNVRTLIEAQYFIEIHYLSPCVWMRTLLEPNDLRAFC